MCYSLLHCFNLTAAFRYSWSITGGTITSTTSNSIFYTAGASGTVLLSVTATNQCGTGPAGTRNVSIQQPLSPPINFSATTQSNSSVVALTWLQGASGPTSYRIERKDCSGCSWIVIGPNPTTSTSYNDPVSSSATPAAHLYHVVAVAKGSGWKTTSTATGCSWERTVNPRRADAAT